MIITTIEELRLHSPAHALDSIDSLVGFIDNSEHDFLEEKLGTPLYQHLQAWYDANQSLMSQVSAPMIGDTTLPPYNRLCLLAQRCVAFDALGRAIGMQVVSVNNSGVNQMVTDDYVAPDKNGKTIEMYRETCNREAHAAVNQLLRQLEQWCKMSGDEMSGDGSLAANNGEAETDARDLSPDIEAERKEICELWKQSAYYYQAAALIIPSCEVLQRYLNIYDSREKFIQLLPDMQFIQEEIIGNAIGEELLQVVVDFARDGKLPTDDRGQVPGSPQADENAPARDLSPVIDEPTLGRLLHRLRKVMAALLVGRTSVLKYTKEQKVQAHDDGVRMLQNVVEYIKQNNIVIDGIAVAGAQDSTPGESEAPATPTGGAVSGCSPCPHGKPGEPRDAKPEAACWTPPLL